MAPKTWDDLPAETRLQIWRCSVPSEIEAHTCGSKSPRQCHCYQKNHAYYQLPSILDNNPHPVASLLLVNKQVNAEVSALFTASKPTVYYNSLSCLRWSLSHSTVQRYIHRFSSVKFCFYGIDPFVERHQGIRNVLVEGGGPQTRCAVKRIELLDLINRSQ